MKRIISSILTLTIIILLTGCKEAKNNIINTSQTTENEVLIILSKFNTMNINDEYEEFTYRTNENSTYMEYLEVGTRSFLEDKGTLVKLIYPTANNYEEYLNKRNTELYLEGGPSLVFISGGEEYRNLVKEGVALKVEDKLSNYKNIYSSLKDGYFVPISMAVNTVVLNKKLLKELNLKEPNIEWTEDDFHHIMNTFYQNESAYISPIAVNLMINSKLKEYNLSFNKEGIVEVADKEMVELIENIRYELLESNRFEKRINYKYENYHRMLYELLPESFGYNNFIEEKRDTVDSWGLGIGKNPNIPVMRGSNCLNAIETHRNKSKYIIDENGGGTYYHGDYVDIEPENIILLPRPYPTYSSWGFIVNRNGKNIEQALEFLDYLISDELQLKLYKDIDYYTEYADMTNSNFNSERRLSFTTPVVETIEREIESLEQDEGVDKEIVELRKTTLNQIKEGKRTRNYRGASYRGAYVIGSEEPLIEEQERFLKEELESIIVKAVFADERYSSEKIMMELRELENRLILMFSE